MRAAANLESLPCLAEGLASGALSLDLVAPLAEVASPSSDAALREVSACWNVKQARQFAAWDRACREAEAEATAEAVADAQIATVVAADPDSETGGSAGEAGSVDQDFERRTLRFNDTRRSVWVAFTKDDYAVAKSALVGRVAAENRETENHEMTGGERVAATSTSASASASASASISDPLGYIPYDKRLDDALIDLFRMGSSSGSGGAHIAGPVVRPKVVVHAPLQLLVGCSKEGVAEIAGVGPVPAAVVRRLACDADVDVAVEDLNGSILKQGRARRDPTPVQRIEIDRRDKGCRFPGCTYTEFTNVHHIRHWADGGLTDLDNLVTLCGRHHRTVHELGWSVSGSADAVLDFTSPHGRSMQSAPSPTWRPSSVIRSGQKDRHRPLRR